VAVVCYSQSGRAVQTPASEQSSPRSQPDPELDGTHASPSFLGGWHVLAPRSMATCSDVSRRRKTRRPSSRDTFRTVRRIVTASRKCPCTAGRCGDTPCRRKLRPPPRWAGTLRHRRRCARNPRRPRRRHRRRRIRPARPSMAQARTARTSAIDDRTRRSRTARFLRTRYRPVGCHGGHRTSRLPVCPKGSRYSDIADHALPPRRNACGPPNRERRVESRKTRSLRSALRRNAPRYPCRTRRVRACIRGTPSRRPTNNCDTRRRDRSPRRPHRRRRRPVRD